MFTILFACTGNRCRSPYAQVHLARLVADLPVEVISAGTLDAPGNRVPGELIQIGGEAGGALTRHRSRYLGDLDNADVDLFIGFERGHVASAVVDAGVDADKAFTLPEVVRLLRTTAVPSEADPVARARAAVQAAHEARREGDFVAGEEVVDPFHRSRRVYEEVAQQITDLTDELYELLFSRSAGAQSTP